MPALRKIFALAAFMAAATSLSAQSADFTGSLNRFLEDMNKNLPDTALAGGTWSDAYIGQLIPLPPHLGIGLSCGLSRFPVSALSSAAGHAGSGIDILSFIEEGYLSLINPAIELRVGGFKLPFDFGARFSMLPSNSSLYGVELSYRSVSVDARYALIEEGIGLPEVAVGIGWYYASGNIGCSFSADELTEAGFTASSGGKLGVEFKTNVFEARVQVSKSLLIFTPYLGVTGYYAISESSYEIAGMREEVSGDYWGSRIYGGCSFNIFLVKIDVSASYNFTTQNWGANVGARLQL